MCKYRSRENSIPLTALGKAAVSAQRQCWGRGGQAVGGTAGWGIWKCPIREFNSLTRARVLLFLRSPHTPHWPPHIRHRASCVLSSYLGQQTSRCVFIYRI